MHRYDETRENTPSQLLKQFSSRPRKHDLAIALGETGRIARSLFMIEWVLDINMQRRANVGVNKGEGHHALKNALRIGRLGEIRLRNPKSAFPHGRTEPSHRHHYTLNHRATGKGRHAA